MKILVLPSWYPPFGGVFGRNQSEALQARGHEVYVLTFEYRSLKKFRPRHLFRKKRITYHEENGLKVYRGVYWKLPKLEKLNTLLWASKYVKAYKKIFSGSNAPDIAHVHCSVWAGWIAFRLKKEHGLPYVITENRARFMNNRSFSDPYFKKKWVYDILQPVMVNASCLIPVSHLLIPRMKEFLPNDETPFKVIPNIVHTDFFTLKERPKPAVFQFIMVGALVPVKGMSTLLKAMKRLQDKHPQTTLKIVGDGYLKKSLTSSRDQLGLSSVVEFTGKLNKEGVRDALHESNAFVLSSRAEACPQVVQEAMSTGLPVVATNIIDSHIVPPQAGYIVDVDDDEALAAGMEKMLSNYDTFNAKEIHNYCEKHFTEKVVVEQIEHVFHQALK